MTAEYYLNAFLSTWVSWVLIALAASVVSAVLCLIVIPRVYGVGDRRKTRDGGPNGRIGLREVQNSPAWVRSHTGPIPTTLPPPPLASGDGLRALPGQPAPHIPAPPAPGGAESPRQTHRRFCVRVLQMGANLAPSLGLVGTIEGILRGFTNTPLEQLPGVMGMAMLTTYVGAVIFVVSYFVLCVIGEEDGQ